MNTIHDAFRPQTVQKMQRLKFGLAQWRPLLRCVQGFVQVPVLPRVSFPNPLFQGQVGCRTCSTLDKVLCTRYKVHSTMYKIQGAQCKVQGMKCKLQGTKWWALLSSVQLSSVQSGHCKVQRRMCKAHNAKCNVQGMKWKLQGTQWWALLRSVQGGHCKVQRRMCTAHKGTRYKVKGQGTQCKKHSVWRCWGVSKVESSVGVLTNTGLWLHLSLGFLILYIA